MTEISDITTARSRYRPLASLTDAQGHRVTATVTPSGLLAVVTCTADEGIRSGHPCLDREQAAALRDALDEFIGGGQ